MDLRRSVPAVLLAVALTAAVLGAREAAKEERVAAREAPPEDAATAVAVLVAPPERADPESLVKALTAASEALGDRPRDVVDARGGAAAAAARLDLTKPREAWLVGDAPEGRVFAKRFPVESRPAAPKPALAEVRYSEKGPASRPVRLTLAGEGLTPADVRVSVDGAEVKGREVKVRGDGSLDVSIPGLATGVRRIEVAGKPGEAPIVVKIECTEPPAVLRYGNPDHVAARALTAQGFTVLDAADGKEAGLWLLTDTAADHARVAASVAKGAGCLVVGPDAAGAAVKSPLGAWLPAKLAPAPESKPAPPKDPEVKPPTPKPPTPDEPKKPDPVKPDPDSPKPENPNPNDPAAPKPKLEKREEDAPVVALAIVLDRSGSMFGDKLKLAKQAALASSEVLAPDDFLTVISFGDDTKVEYALGRVGAKALLQSKVGQIHIDELHMGTLFYPAITEAANQLTRANLAARHIVLITDGATSDRFTSNYEELIRTRLTPDGVTVSTVFIQGEGDQDFEFLRWLAMLGRGQAVIARQNAAIPALVLAEVRRRFGIPEGGTRRAPSKPDEAKAPPEPPKKEEPPKPKPDGPKPEPPKPDLTERRIRVAAEPGSAVMEGIDVAGLDAVGGFRFLEPEAGASVILRSAEGGEALLAARAAGEGASAILAIAEKGGLERWAGDPRMQQIFGRLATALFRDAPASTLDETDSALHAVVNSGFLHAEGRDPLGLLGELAPAGLPARVSVEVGAAASGSTRLGEDGRRRNSLRLAGSKEAAAADARARSRAEELLTKLDRPAAGSPADAPRPSRGRPSPAPWLFLLSMAAAATALGAARRVS